MERARNASITVLRSNGIVTRVENPSTSITVIIDRTAPRKLVEHDEVLSRRWLVFSRAWKASGQRLIPTTMCLHPRGPQRYNAGYSGPQVSCILVHARSWKASSGSHGLGNFGWVTDDCIFISMPLYQCSGNKVVYDQFEICLRSPYGLGNDSIYPT